MKIVIGLVVAAVALFALAAWRNGAVRPDQPNATDVSPGACLAISDVEPSLDEPSIKINGTMTNNCSASFRYVQVTYKFFDESNSIVGSALANMTGLERGQTWKFQAFGLFPSKMKSYRLDKMTAY